MAFVAFKSKIDAETTNALLNSGGRVFEADIGLMVDSFEDKETGKEISYFKLVINEARGDVAKPVDAHNSAKGNGYVSEFEDSDDDSIPF